MKKDKLKKEILEGLNERLAPLCNKYVLFMEGEGYPQIFDDELRKTRHFFKFTIGRIRKEEREKIMGNLLQRFNDYETPIQMTAKDVREIIKDEISK